MAFVVLLLAIILAARWRYGSFDWSLFASTLTTVRAPWLAAAAAVALATYYGRALRWAVLIRHLRPAPSLWGLFSDTAIGFTAIVLLGRPGELVRPYLIASREKLPFSSQVAAWFLERICDLLSALLIFGIALAELERSGARVGPRLRWVLEAGGYLAGAVGLGSVLVLLLLRHFSGRMRARVLDGLAFLPDRWRLKATELFDAFLLGVEATRTRAGLVGLVAYTILEWALIALCFVAMMKAFPVVAHFSLADVMVLIGFIAFGSLVQIPGIGGGVQVITIVVLTEIYRIPLATATGIGLLIWFVTFVVVVPIGLVLFMRRGLSWSRIREMGSTTKT